MLKTTKRHLELLSWLYWHDNIQSWSRLQFYSFLFLYELRNIEEERRTSAWTEYDISSLVATPDGPVFTTLRDDMTNRPVELLQYIESHHKFGLDTQWARACSFAVKSMTANELKDIMYEFYMWYCASQHFGTQSEVPMLEEHIVDEEDFTLLSLLLGSVPEYEYEILTINDKRFVLSMQDFQSLNDKQFDVLTQLSTQEQLYNPVYVHIDTNERLVVDD